MSVDPQFKSAIKDWYKYNRDEKELKSRLQNLKKDKEGVENIIINYMQSKNIQNNPIYIGEDVMQYTETKSYETVTKKLLMERLSEYLNSEERAKEAVEYIYVNRTHNVKSNLKLNTGKKGETDNDE